MYKVFFNESVIKIDSQFNKSLNSKTPKLVDTNVYHYEDQLILDVESGENGSEFLIFNPDVSQVWNRFRASFKEIPAAGGLVQNAEGSFLFIKRLGVWDLPKGKIEKNETPEDAAIREVEEECGLTNLRIVESLDSTFHIYRSPYLPLPNNLVLKETRWFLMHYSGNDTPVPQVEENIEEVRWFALSELEQVLSNTYSSLCDFLEKSLSLS